MLKLNHYLFHCPSFWSLKPKFKCPICGKKYRCYWDGNDIKNNGTDICNNCERKIEKQEAENENIN
jgi:transcription elongation factor Elf1